MNLKSNSYLNRVAGGLSFAKKGIDLGSVHGLKQTQELLPAAKGDFEMRSGKMLAGLLVVAILGLATPSSAYAIFQLKFQVGADTLIVNDNSLAPQSGAGYSITGDGNAAPGAMFVTGTIDGFTFTAGTTATSNSSSSAAMAQITITQVFLTNVSAGNGATFMVSASDVNFSTQPPPLTLQASQQIFISTPGPSKTLGVLSTVGTASAANTNFAAGTSTTSISSSTPGGAAVFSVPVVLPFGAPFSLTDKSIITMDQGASIFYESEADVTPAPAPTSLVMGMAGLPAFGIMFVLRRKLNLSGLAA